MTKLVLTALSLFLALSPSQAKTSAAAQVLDSHKRSVSMSQMRTKSVLARAAPRAQRRLLVTNNASDGDDGPPGTDELGFHQAYRRPELVKDSDSGLSNYVRTRLLVSRIRALKKYQEVWG